MPEDTQRIQHHTTLLALSNPTSLQLQSNPTSQLVFSVGGEYLWSIISSSKMKLDSIEKTSCEVVRLKSDPEECATKRMARNGDGMRNHRLVSPPEKWETQLTATLQTAETQHHKQQLSSQESRKVYREATRRQICRPLHCELHTPFLDRPCTGECPTPWCLVQIMQTLTLSGDLNKPSPITRLQVRFQTRILTKIGWVCGNSQKIWSSPSSPQGSDPFTSCSTLKRKHNVERHERTCANPTPRRTSEPAVLHPSLNMLFRSPLPDEPVISASGSSFFFRLPC